MEFNKESLWELKEILWIRKEAQRIPFGLLNLWFLVDLSGNLQSSMWNCCGHFLIFEDLCGSP